MNQPLVSVVIVVDNSAEYLSETLDSVLASDYANIELLLVDEGSTDNSAEIMQRYAGRDGRVRPYSKEKSNICIARNFAIERATGKYILPLYATDLISPGFIYDAVKVLEADKSGEIKAVYARVELFGRHSGRRHLPTFSPRRLACRNIIGPTALYRREDWVRVGGYCERIVASGTWDFWIALIADGGTMHCLPDTGIFMRTGCGGKPRYDKNFRRRVIDVLNRRHSAFFRKYLGGRLHFLSYLSYLLNLLSRVFYPQHTVVSDECSPVVADFVLSLPAIFDGEEDVVRSGRNVLKRFRVEDENFIVKAYGLPHFVYRFVYRMLRASKAERAYRYGLELESLGVGTPAPVAYVTTGWWFLIGRSFFVAKESACPYAYRDLENRDFPNRVDILRAIAQTTAKLHSAGWLHKDYSAENILFRTLPGGRVLTEIVDLNRMRFGEVDMVSGCRNFERLPGTPEMLRIMAEAYADARGYEPDACYGLILEACREGGMLRKLS